MKRKGETGKKLGIALSVILTVGWLFPYIYVICCAFKPGSEVIAVPPKFFPKVFSIENFSGLLERMDAMKFFVQQSDSCSYQHNHCPDPWFSCGLCYSEIRRKAVSSVNRFGAVSENDSYV